LYYTPDVMRGKKFINVISGINEKSQFFVFAVAVRVLLLARSNKL